MSLTLEQEAVVRAGVRLYWQDDDGLLKVKAIAGAGKTHTLIELTKEINPNKGLYLAYNKSIQLEATQKFKGTNVVCKTMHGLAFKETVIPYGLSVQNFSARDIKEKLTYDNKIDLVNMLESFFLSGELDVRKYLEDKEVSEAAIELLLRYYEEMLHGRQGGGHSFYLKLYHILLANGTIQPPEVDLLMVDEFGDITALTIEIFKLIKAKLKVAVGDSGQNIYSFAHTIDGFKALQDQGEQLKLTQSFRVSSDIAKRIESFARRSFDKDMEFKGNSTIVPTRFESMAYVSRNNSALITKMYELIMKDIPFQTTKAPSTIFGFILAVATLKAGKPVFDVKYKWLEAVATKHQKLVISGRAPSSILLYLESVYGTDQSMMGAINIIKKIGADRLFKIYTIAKDYYADSNTYQMTLTTAHSAKGLEYQSVTIADDLNMALQKASLDLGLNPSDDKREKLLEEFRIYYVACSRAMHELNNAKYC